MKVGEKQLAKHGAHAWGSGSPGKMSTRKRKEGRNLDSTSLVARRA